jgi:hypothetical protein
MKDKHLAQLIEHEFNQNPTMKVTNATRSPIYIYRDSCDLYLECALEPEDAYSFHKLAIPFKKNALTNYTITNHDYGDRVTLSQLQPIHVMKFLTIEYGTHETVTITQQSLTKEDQWKECALKSLYLLTQLDRLGAKNNPNYEAILDMVQDIEYPEYSEQDKERAGITSAFTNIHTTTGIDEH